MGFVFNEFVVDAKAFRLLRDGQEVRIERRAFDLLHYLITHRDRMVPKEELLEQVWGARALTDGALSNTVAKLRRALRQTAQDRQPIETVHGRGYRFHLPDSSPAPEDALPRRPVEHASVQGAAHSDSSAAPARDPFVGRQALMRGLVQRLAQGASSSESLIVLAGEAGIGKTRTARELAAHARAGGYSVWLGAAYEGAGAPAYWPWIEVLRSAHAELPKALWQAETQAGLARGPWAVAQLVPELDVVPVATPNVEPLMARFQLFDEVARILKRAAAQRPRLVLLDDLQSADLGSIELLQFVVRALQGQPVMFVATLRTGEPAVRNQGSPLEQLARVATVLRLPGLSADEVAQLATALTGNRLVEPRHARLLHARTQGNPLFVRQALDLITQRDDWSFVEEGAPAAELPPTILHVIRRRLVGLSNATLCVLEAAAVIGKSFAAPMLAEVCQMSSAELAEQLDTALRIGLVERAPGYADSYVFAHVLLRDSLYEGLPRKACGELHGRLARSLSQRNGLGRSHELGAIAHHALLALPFELERAVDACRRAAKAAQEASSFEVAAQLRIRAIDKITSHGGPVELHCRLLLELGEDQFYAGLITSAWNAFRDAVEAARSHGRLDLLAELAPRLVDCLELGVGEPWLARAVVDQALLSPGTCSQAEQASLLAQRAELALELPVDQRFELLDQAAALAEQGADHAAMLEVAHSRAILRDPTRLPQNHAAARHFLALASRYPEAAAGMRYRSLRPFGAFLTQYLCALTACDLAAADLALEQCAKIAELSHVRAARLGVALMRAGRALAEGRLEDLQRLIPLPLGAAASELPSESDAWTGYLCALLEARDKLGAGGLLPVLASFSPQPPAAKHRIYVTVGHARLLSGIDQHDRARALLAQLPGDELARMPVQYGDLGILCALAEITYAQGDLTAARRLYPRLLPHAAQNGVGPSFEYRGAVAHFAGLLAGMQGDAQQASALFQQAIVINRKLGMTSQLVHSERALAESTRQLP